MPDSLSAQLLSIIQQALKAKNQNTASLARLTKIPRKQLKNILSSQEPLTVDALASIAEALRLDAEALKQFGFATPPQEESPALKLTTVRANPSEENWTPDPFGNHHHQLIQMGFSLGVNFWLVLDTKKIENSGVPKYVLEKHSPLLRIQLESQYHPYIEPKYTEQTLSLRLSFDALYTCTFTWDSVIQIIFIPTIPEPSEPEEERTTKRPTLRVVK